MDNTRQKSGEPDTLALLKAIQPSTLYLITSKTIFLQGFHDYKTEALQSFLWVDAKRRLQAVLFDAALFTVTFSTKEKRLYYECTCQNWTTAAHCKHVICSFLTVLNLLSPKLFHRKEQDKQRIERLKWLLLGEKEMAKPESLKSTQGNQDETIEVVIESKGDYPAVFLRKGGTFVDSPVGLPEGLSPFTYRYFNDHSLHNRFVAYLKQFGNRYPLVLESDLGKISLEWDASLRYHAKTGLNVSNAVVEIQALSLFENTVCEGVTRFWDFIVNRETGKLGRVVETAGWHLYDNLDQMFRTPASFDDFDETEDQRLTGREWIVPNCHFKIPLSTFQSIQFNMAESTLNETLSHLVLKVGGSEVSPMKSKHHYRLTIQPTHEETATIETESWFHNVRGVTTAHTFNFFTDIYTRDLPVAIKALKRLVVLYQTFFHLFRVEKKMEATKVIKKALSIVDFSEFAVKQAARDLLKHYYTTIQEKDVRLHYHENNWFIVPNEKQKEARLYEILFEQFGPKAFKEMMTYHQITLPKEQLYSAFSEVYAQCKAAEIDLYHKGKPVKTVKWDFSFDARQRSGIDWFEIRPEIRSDGVVVSDAVFLELLQKRGMVEEEGEIQIVDSTAQKIIDALALIYKSSASDTRGKKEIVQVPRLEIFDWIALRKQGVAVRLSEEDEALIKHLTQLDTIEEITTPRNLLTKLRPYQKEGLDWLAFLYQHRFGAILADDMGLGKTLQAIALLAGLKEKIIRPMVQNETLHQNGPDLSKYLPPHSPPDLPPHLSAHLPPHLIVVPPTLLFNWEQELNRFYPKLKVYQYVGKDRKTRFEPFDVVLTTYALVRRDIKILKKIPFHVIIFDEAQAVKNLYADTTGAVRQLNGLFKLVMTGTPLENHIGEYYSLIDLSLPGLLGGYDLFKSQVKQDDSPMLQVLIRRTRPFVLRRIKESVLKDLPSKVETNIYLSLTAKQKQLYEQTVAAISSQINRAYRDKTTGQANIIALTAILKLRQLCVSPRLIVADFKEDIDHSPKITFLLNQLVELFEEGHSALVFSQFTRGLDLLEEAFKLAGIPFSRLDGSTPTPKRKKLVEAFQKNESPSVFLLSLKAGGQGLNLTRASYVFHLDPWWNPAVENQASDRVHRIGQKQKVSITRILMRHTIEEKMVRLKKKKLALYDAVMGGAEKGGQGYTISKSDFDFLLEG